jgi:phage gpG-like protein
VGARVDFDFSELAAVIEEMGANVADVPRALPVVAEALVSRVADVFDAEGAVGGRPRWQDLAESTKRRRGGSYMILQDSGLMANVHPTWDDTMAGAYSNAPYAVFHVSPLPRRVIPLRDFFAIDTEAFNAEATEIVLATLTQAP